VEIVKDSDRSSKITAFDLLATVLAASVIIAISMRNMALEQKNQDLANDITKKEAEIRGLERGVIFGK
jgi:cell division protein FtsB